jgi:hypothetical protein
VFTRACHWLLSCHLHLGLLSGLFPSGFPIKILYVSLPCMLHDQHKANKIFTIKIAGVGHNIYTSSFQICYMEKDYDAEIKWCLSSILPKEEIKKDYNINSQFQNVINIQCVSIWHGFLLTFKTGLITSLIDDINEVRYEIASDEALNHELPPSRFCIIGSVNKVKKITSFFWGNQYLLNVPEFNVW